MLSRRTRQAIINTVLVAGLIGVCVVEEAKPTASGEWYLSLDGIVSGIDGTPMPLERCLKATGKIWEQYKIIAACVKADTK